MDCRSAMASTLCHSYRGHGGWCYLMGTGPRCEHTFPTTMRRQALNGLSGPTLCFPLFLLSSLRRDYSLAAWSAFSIFGLVVASTGIACCVFTPLRYGFS